VYLASHPANAERIDALGGPALRIRDFGRMGKTTVRPEHPARP